MHFINLNVLQMCIKKLWQLLRKKVHCCVLFRCCRQFCSKLCYLSIVFTSFPLSSPIRCIWWDILTINSKKKKKEKEENSRRSISAGVIHSCEQVQQCCPLGRIDTLAHVDDAVHGYIRVGLHQAEIQRKRDWHHSWVFTSKNTFEHFLKTRSRSWSLQDSRNCAPANVFQGVFFLQVLDVLPNCRLDAVLLGQMLLEPLDHHLVVIPEISLNWAAGTL